jgi:Leucine-rich repeat (LRR) protein
MSRLIFILFVFFSLGVTKNNDQLIIDLSKKKLKEIPSYVFENKNLKVLKLFGNQLTALPPEIGLLENLEELYLGKNRISKLPNEIKHLKKLRILALRNNRLIELPSEIGELDELEVLWLNQNQLERIPLEMGSLLKLEVLRLDNNNLVDFPSSLCNCYKIEQLNLSYNLLKRLPVEIYQFTSLKTLNLYRAGPLLDVPESLCELRYLEYLKVDETVALPTCALVNRTSRLKIEIQD